MPRKVLPKIPKQLELAAGPAKVVWEKGLLETERAAGKFEWPTRTVTLDASLKGSAAWLTLEHERVHIVLMDAGVQLSEELEERVCDAIAADRVAEIVRARGRS